MDRAHEPRSAAPARERGVVMIIALISLALLLIGASALMRSFGTSATLAGNLAFKRDLTNHADRAIVLVEKVLSGTGALTLETTRQSNLLAQNYSATRLAPPANDNGNGIPAVLLSDSAFTAAGFAHADITDDDAGIVIRYVVDRLCTQTGAWDESRCTVIPLDPDSGGTEHLHKPDGEKRPVYRISVRVTGPRQTQAFFQSIMQY